MSLPRRSRRSQRQTKLHPHGIRRLVLHTVICWTQSQRLIRAEAIRRTFHARDSKPCLAHKQGVWLRDRIAAAFRSHQVPRTGDCQSIRREELIRRDRTTTRINRFVSRSYIGESCTRAGSARKVYGNGAAFNANTLSLRSMPMRENCRSPSNNHKKWPISLAVCIPSSRFRHSGHFQISSINHV